VNNTGTVEQVKSMKHNSGLRALLLMGVATLASVAVWAQAGPKKGAGAGQSTATPPEYRIGPGDVLQISVFKEPDASVPEATVRSDGKISMPFVGDVDVQGLTPSFLEKALTQKLLPFIKDPDVSVVVKSVQSEKVYVIGQVKKSGPIKLTGTMKVLEALSEAGLDDFAKPNKIFVLRNNAKLPFHYKDVIQGKHAEENILLQPGDTIVVP
jgi:polysaccharide export outer membrane protein